MINWRKCGKCPHTGVHWHYGEFLVQLEKGHLNVLHLTSAFSDKFGLPHYAGMPVSCEASLPDALQVVSDDIWSFCETTFSHIRSLSASNRFKLWNYRHFPIVYIIDLFPNMPIDLLTEMVDCYKSHQTVRSIGTKYCYLCIALLKAENIELISRKFLSAIRDHFCGHGLESQIGELCQFKSIDLDFAYELLTAIRESFSASQALEKVLVNNLRFNEQQIENLLLLT